MSLVSTIETLLEDEKTNTPIPTSTPKPTVTATVIPTATPVTKQILPSLLMTMASEPSFPSLPAHIAGRCGDSIGSIVTGFGCYFDDHISAFFVNEEHYGCIYQRDQDLTECEAWLWEFANFCVERVVDIEWDYRWQIRRTCTTSPTGPTPTSIPKSPIAEAEGLGYCQNDWFLQAGEGCHIRHAALFFWVTSDNEGCLAREGSQEQDCYPSEFFQVLQIEGHTIPLLLQRTTKFEEGEGWKLASVEPAF